MMKQGKHFFYFCCFPLYPLWCFVIDQGSYGVLKSMKKMVIFQSGKNFLLVC